MKIIITGASRGIGAKIAEALDREGHRVLSLSRTPPLPSIDHFPIDLSSAQKRKEAENGLRKLECDCLILNAGGALFGNIEELSFSSIEELIQLNLLAPIFLTKLFLPQMREKKRGDLIFIGSVAATECGRQGSVYSASKAALAAFCRSIRKESRNSHVRCSLIEPGMAATSFYENLHFAPKKEEGYFLYGDEIASAVSLILNSSQSAVFDEIRISPLKHGIDFTSG